MHGRSLARFYSLESTQTANAVAPALSPEEKALQELEEESCWKTNLMLNQELERVDERNRLFRKRTSFEEHLINDHLRQMRKILSLTGLQVGSEELPKSDKKLPEHKKLKKIEVIESNTYLTEEEKWELTEMFLTNQENYSILVRMSQTFIESKDELVYLLCSIISFATDQVSAKKSINSAKETSLEVESSRLALVDKILNQENIKLVSPLFFSNENEAPLMEIVDNWFFNVLCIKRGVYDEPMDLQETGMEENLFMD